MTWAFKTYPGRGHWRTTQNRPDFRESNFRGKLYTHSKTEYHRKTCSTSLIIKKNENLTHHEVWPHTVQNGHQQEVHAQSMLEGTGGKETVPPLLGWESKLLTGAMRATEKTKYRNTIGPGNLIQGHVSRENPRLKRQVHPNLQCSTIHSS